MFIAVHSFDLLILTLLTYLFTVNLLILDILMFVKEKKWNGVSSFCHD